MNAEQKQRAKRRADKLACGRYGRPAARAGGRAETEPVARVTGYYAGYLSIATVDGRVLPAGTALYAAPPHQLAPPNGQHASAERAGCGEYLKRRAEEIVAGCEKTTQKLIARLLLSYGHCKMPAEATTQAEAPADVARDAGGIGGFSNGFSKRQIVSTSQTAACKTV